MKTRRPVLGISKTGAPVTIDEKTRTTSMHIVGAPGTGKTKFIESLVRQDILDRRGVCLIDPHGHLFENIVRWCTWMQLDRGRKILILDPSAPDFAFSFNPLDFRRYAHKGGEATGKKKPFHVYIDECADFINEDVAKILTEGRKFGLHLTLAHQDLGQLKREGERVYKAVMNSARTKVVFAVQDPEDAEIIADLIFTGEYDMEERKRSLDKPTVVGYARRIFEGRSTSRGTTSSTTTTSAPSSTSETTNQDGEVVSTARTEGEPSESTTYGESEGEGFSYTEGLEPIFEVLPGQVHTLEEQIHKAIARIVNQPERHAFVKMPSLRSVQITVPPVQDAVVRPEFAADFKRRHGLIKGFAADITQIQAEQAERTALFFDTIHAARTPPEPVEPESFRE